MEAKYPEFFLQRARALLHPIQTEECDIVCVQEYWFESSYQNLFKQTLGKSYHIHTLQSPGSNEDGLAIFTKKHLQIESITDLSFDMAGERVAILMHLLIDQVPFILVNSHLTFPHSDLNRLVRLQQIQTTLDAISTKRIEDCPVLMCGDFNDQRDPVHHCILDHGYASAFCTVHGRDAHVTHCNHNHGEVGVDFIFMHNAPNAKVRFQPTSCELVPKRLSDRTLLERPKFGHEWTDLDQDYSALVEDDDLVQYWSLLSDHRPLVAKFDVVHG